VNREGFRAVLLGAVLLAALADAVVVKHSSERMLLGLGLLVAAALVLFSMRGSKEPDEAAEPTAQPAAALPAVPEPAAPAPVAVATADESAPVPTARSGRRLSLRDLLPARRGARIEAALDDLRRQLDAQQQLTAELRLKLGHHDGLRRAMWQTIEDRFTAIETTQRGEVAALREARERHSAGIEKLQARLEAHTREVAALTQVFDALEGDSETEADTETEQPLRASVAS